MDLPEKFAVSEAGDAIDRARVSAAAMAHEFGGWIEQNRDVLTPLLDDGEVDFGGRVDRLLALQRVLFDQGWARLGWAEEVGGLGGSALLRCAQLEILEDAGFPPRAILEHLEIIAPALVRFAPPELARELLPKTLRGDIRWCQGFSEPYAGSDLASLRTKAEAVDGGFSLRGHKIWTSWAKWATHATVIARTGAPDSRHRGLTMFVVPLDTPGLEVNIIRQLNGTDEFAEVFLDGAFVPDSNRVGELDGGWAVAMFLLSCERGAFAWQRHLSISPRLGAACRQATDDRAARALGCAAASMLSVRARAWTTMRELALGGAPGPEAAVNKVLICDGENEAYDAIAESLGSTLEIGDNPEHARWQEDYLFSRATPIYGGTRQIQLNIIANHLLRKQAVASADDYDAFLDGILTALEDAEDTPGVLEGLDWWQSAGPEAEGEGRLALGALFEAQGRRLTLSPALGALLAHPVIAAAGKDLGLKAGAALHASRLSDDTVRLWLAPGASNASHIAITLPEGSSAIVDRARCRFLPSTAIEPAWLEMADVDAADLQPVEVAPEQRERALAEARVALGFEALGACEVMLASAAEHASSREQFGKPIAEFQAVKHILAEAHLATTALREVCKLALSRLQQGELELELAAMLKLNAGRAGRTVAKHAMQVLGAIGFTEEHPHSGYTHRVVMIDGVLGSAAEIGREIGRQMIETGRVPRGPGIADLPGADA